MSSNTFANLVASSGAGASHQLNGGRATEYVPDHNELLAQCHFIIAGLEPAQGLEQRPQNLDNAVLCIAVLGLPYILGRVTIGSRSALPYFSLCSGLFEIHFVFFGPSGRI